MTDPQAELERARADHAATMARLKGKTGREAEDELLRSVRRLRLAHREAAVAELGLGRTAKEGE